MTVGQLCISARTRAGMLALVFVAMLATDAGAQTILARVPVPPNAAANVAVNPHLNKIYMSGGAAERQDVFVVNGKNFKIKRVGPGSAVSVDTTTDNYWAATVAGGRAIVRRGSDNAELYRVATSEGCPVTTSFDTRARRVWLQNQCGEHGDQIYMFDGDQFALIAGPIRPGGTLGTAVVNSATGRLYIAPGGVSKRLDPVSFQITGNNFGIVQAFEPVTGKLFALSGQTLQIINAIRDPEVISVSIDLGYSPGGIAADFALGRIYLSNPGQSSIEVRMISTGDLLTTIALGAGVTPGNLAADSTRGRLYVAATKGIQNFLIAIGDPTVRSKDDDN